MRTRRSTLRSNIALSLRKPSSLISSRHPDFPAASQTESLLAGVISLSSMTVRSVFLGFASLFRKDPIKTIVDLAHRKRILSTSLLVAAGGAMIAIFEPLTRLDRFDASDWVSTAMLGSHSPNFFLRFGCAFTVGLVFYQGYATLLKIAGGARERQGLEALGAMLYFLVMVSAIVMLQTTNSVVGSSPLFLSETSRVIGITGAFAPLILMSFACALCTIRVGVESRFGPRLDKRKRLRILSLAVLLGIGGVSLPSAAVFSIAKLTREVEDFIDQAQKQVERRPLKAEFLPIGVNCATDRADDNIMNCVFVADMKGSAPISFDLSAANLIYAVPRPPELAARRFSYQDEQGNPHAQDNVDSFVYTDMLKGDSGISEVGDAVKSDHVVTIQPGKRLILRLRLHAPGDCTQFKRPYDLKDVYVKVRLIHPNLMTPPYLFIGPWRFDSRELHYSPCSGSRPLPGDDNS